MAPNVAKYSERGNDVMNPQVAPGYPDAGNHGGLGGQADHPWSSEAKCQGLERNDRMRCADRLPAVIVLQAIS